MGEETLANLLADAAPLQNLTQEETMRLAGAGRLLTFAKGQDLLKEGDEGHEMLILLRGSASVWKQDTDKGESVRLNNVEAGEVLGEIACLRDERRLATVRAEEGCLVFELSRDRFDELLNKGDLAAYKLALKMARNLANRLAWTNDKIFGILHQHSCDPESGEFDQIKDEFLDKWEF